jgi:hypothetical protein
MHSTDDIGIFPGRGYPADLLSEESGKFFLDYIFPQATDHPLVQLAIDSAAAEWHEYFPDADEDEARMFQAGAIALSLWLTQALVILSNHYQVDPRTEALWVQTDSIQRIIDMVTTRLVTTVFYVHDTETVPLSDLPPLTTEGSEA